MNQLPRRLDHPCTRYSRVPNKRINTFIFFQTKNYIKLLGPVLTPSRAIFDKSALLGVKTDPNKRICLGKMSKTIVLIHLLGTREYIRQHETKGTFESLSRIFFLGLFHLA